MKAQETTLKAMLEGQKQYMVPLYQRRYAWSQPEWKPLWGAVTREYTELASQEDDRGHFLGSLVVQQMDTMAHGIQRFSIIDGQQRLTTTFILLTVLRDLAQDDHLREQIQNIYLTNPFAKGEFVPKLRLGSQDQPDIERLVNGDFDSASGKIGAAYWWFRNEVELLEAKSGVDRQRLVEAVTSRMEVVDIAADTRDNAYRIFQTLNSTGKQLTAVDLLRNHFFMLLPTHADEAYLDHWAPMEALLGPNFGAFLWVELVSRGHGKESVPTGGVYAAWQADLEAITGQEAAVFAALQRLHEMAALYDAILKPDNLAVPNGEVVRAALERLHAWGTPIQHPVVLHLLTRLHDGEVDADDAASALSLIESFLVRRMLVRVPTNNLNRIFTTVVGQLSDASGPLAAALRMILSGPGKYWPSDQEVLSAAVTEPFYLTQRGTQRQYVLRMLEENQRGKYKPDWNACSFSVEHVLPQTPSPWWFKHLEESGEAEPAAAHGELVHIIGNVTLTCENAELGNQSFPDKKPYLRADILAMNKAIVEEAQWTRKEIIARSKSLAKRAVRIWEPPAATGDGSEPQWDLMIASLAQLPEGRWTSYDDLADLAATSAANVRTRFLAMKPMPARAEAILLADGRLDTDRPDVAGNVSAYRQLLVSQGVLEDLKAGSAPPEQRFLPQDFSQLLGEE